MLQYLLLISPLYRINAQNPANKATPHPATPIFTLPSPILAAPPVFVALALALAAEALPAVEDPAADVALPDAEDTVLVADPERPLDAKLPATPAEDVTLTLAAFVASVALPVIAPGPCIPETV